MGFDIQAPRSSAVNLVTQVKKDDKGCCQVLFEKIIGVGRRAHWLYRKVSLARLIQVLNKKKKSKEKKC